MRRRGTCGLCPTQVIPHHEADDILYSAVDVLTAWLRAAPPWPPRQTRPGPERVHRRSHGLVRTRSVDLRHGGSHWPQVGRDLAAVVDDVEQEAPRRRVTRIGHDLLAL